MSAAIIFGVRNVVFRPGDGTVLAVFFGESCIPNIHSTIVRGGCCVEGADVYMALVNMAVDNHGAMVTNCSRFVGPMQH